MRLITMYVILSFFYLLEMNIFESFLTEYKAFLLIIFDLLHRIQEVISCLIVTLYLCWLVLMVNLTQFKTWEGFQLRNY